MLTHDLYNSAYHRWFRAGIESSKLRRNQ